MLYSSNRSYDSSIVRLLFVLAKFVETKVTMGIQRHIVMADEKTTHRTVRFDYKCDLPYFREEMTVEPHIIVGQEHTHARVGMKPPNELFLRETFFHLIIHGYKTVLSERQESTSLSRMTGGQYAIDENKGVAAFLVLVPLPDKSASDFTFKIRPGMSTESDKGFWCDKYRNGSLDALLERGDPPTGTRKGYP
jgi:hypothetical protein